MSRIQILDENVANRIAAGEVVERPASIVKELVENSLDAGAKRVEVQLAAGGKDLIRVIDDGSGMSAEDLRLAVQRFATSKIQAAEDLDTILTMGFRGEALPSIGAVAQLQITTRQADDAEANSIMLRGGSIIEEGIVAAPGGTSVEVTKLFYNTPARAKFLATTATERGHCIEWTQRLALARPDVAFKVIHDGKVLFSTAGRGELREVIAAIYGSNDARLFLPVEARDGDLVIQGYVSSPRLTRATRRTQLFFVNERFIRSSSLSHAVMAAFGMLLPSGRQPLCVLHILMRPEIVDPNVHPTKIEVRFSSPGQVHMAVQMAIEKALADAGLRSLESSSRMSMQRRDGDFARPRPAAGRWEGPAPDATQKAKRLRVNPFAESVDEHEDGLGVFAGQPGTTSTQPRLDVNAAEDAEALGQLANTYIIAKSGRDLLLVNQHRASERVLLQQLSNNESVITRQLLAVPLNLELTPSEAAAVENDTDELFRLGFEFEKFGPSAYILRSIPTALVGDKYEQAVLEMIRELAEWESAPSRTRARAKLAATIACHAAIKANTPLLAGEMQQLIDDLLATDTPAVCPHGDPIIVSINADWLDRKFGR